MLKQILAVITLLLIANISMASSRINLSAGEIKILQLDDIERVAIGNPSVVSYSILENGQVLLIAESEGSSNIHIWFYDGRERDYSVSVTGNSSNLAARKKEVEDLLADIEGLDINIVGERIVLTGNIGFGDEAKIQTVQDAYEEVLVNTNSGVNDLARKKGEIEEMLSDAQGLVVKIIGDKIVLTGTVDNSFEEPIATVQSVFPELLDLTSRASLDMSVPDNKMVLMNIKITEFNKNYLDTLGIAWDTSIPGFSAGVSTLFERGDQLGAPAASGLNFESSAGQGVSSLGYFGIATEIATRINFAVSSGDALILAEPRLAARSGGEATFLSGGEFPIEISNINGTTIEFKEFGIKLSVQPEVDRNNNIRANVSTELSSINNAVAVNGVPGLNTRETQADVIMRAGETLVMSGLLNQEASKDVSGIKFLSEIPILGALFRSENFRDNKSELVIFVTPQVFDSSSEINKQAVMDAKEKIQRFIESVDESSLDIVY